VLELAGIKDVVSKILGTNNSMSNVTATFDALKKMQQTVETKNVFGHTMSGAKK